MIERTAESIIPLPSFQIQPGKPYGPYSRGSKDNPRTPEQTKQDRREYDKRLRERRKELGLCVSCRDDAEPGSVHCAACTEKRRQMKARHKERDRKKATPDQPVQENLWGKPVKS